MVKTLTVPADCEGALQTALRVRIIYLQSYRDQLRAKRLRKEARPEVVASLQRSEEAIMTDIASLTMLADMLAEARSA